MDPTARTARFKDFSNWPTVPQVYIDGKDTGSSTPHKFDGLASGRHKVTLVNNEFGIKETFSVEVKADGVEKQIKDYSDRLPK